MNLVIFSTGESSHLTSLRGFSTPICLSTALWFPVVVAEAAEPAGFVILGCKEGPPKKTRPPLLVPSSTPAWREEGGAQCTPPGRGWRAREEAQGSTQALLLLALALALSLSEPQLLISKRRGLGGGHCFRPLSAEIYTEP